MAKVGFWLRGARGKLAGSVLSKGEFGTVIRENVIPTNPQTSRQMSQRIALATAAQAARYLLPVIGQSFEGQATERDNRREFLRQNVDYLRNAYQQVLAGSLVRNTNWGADGSKWPLARPKNGNTLVPNAYIVSSGSLSAPFNLFEFRIQGNPSNGLFYMGNSTAPKVYTINNGETDLDVAEFFSHFNLHPGDQLTANAIFVDPSARPVNILTRDGLDIDWLKYALFKATRITFKDVWPSSVTITYNDGTPNLQQLADDLYAAVVVPEKTDSNFWDQFFGNLQGRANNDDYYIEINDDPSNWQYLFGLQEDFADIVALGFFRSHYESNSWRYSPCALSLNTALTRNSTAIGSSYYDYGFDYVNARDTYLKSGSSPISDHFVDQGGSDNNV